MSEGTNQEQRNEDALSVLDQATRRKAYWIRPRYAMADLMRVIWQFFTGEPEQENDDDKYERQFIANAIQCKPGTISEQLNAQKVVNGTFARRRLEKWVTRVIVAYLTIVACMIVANGVILVWRGKQMFTDTILITILSTTTVNILGMAFIVLKGHFGHADKPEQGSKENTNACTENSPAQLNA